MLMTNEPLRVTGLLALVTHNNITSVPYIDFMQACPLAVTIVSTAPAKIPILSFFHASLRVAYLTGLSSVVRRRPLVPVIGNPPAWPLAAAYRKAVA